MTTKFKKNKNSGQIALIIVLLMAVVLTIGLSLASRSVTDIRISEDEKEALRAFSAAEAGIEEILRRPSVAEGSYTIDVGPLQAEVKVDVSGEGATQTVEKGGRFNILVEDSGASQLTINWINSENSEETDDLASIEVMVYNTDSSFNRYTYNAYNNSRGNGFDNTPVGGDSPFHSKKVIAVDTDGLGVDSQVVRITPLYNRATIRINSDGLLSAQQYNITSQAVAEGQKIGKVIVKKTVSVLPPIFDYVLFSGSGGLSI